MKGDKIMDFMMIFCRLLLLLGCCFVFFLGGFLLSVIKNGGLKKANMPLPDEEKRRLEKAKKEYDNFLNYDGRVQ